MRTGTRRHSLRPWNSATKLPSSRSAARWTSATPVSSARCFEQACAERQRTIVFLGVPMTVVRATGLVPLCVEILAESSSSSASRTSSSPADPAAPRCNPSVPRWPFVHKFPASSSGLQQVGLHNRPLGTGSPCSHGSDWCSTRTRCASTTTNFLTIRSCRRNAGNPAGLTGDA